MFEEKEKTTSATHRRNDGEKMWRGDSCINDMLKTKVHVSVYTGTTTIVDRMYHREEKKPLYTVADGVKTTSCKCDKTQNC